MRSNEHNMELGDFHLWQFAKHLVQMHLLKSCSTLAGKL